MNDRRKGLGRGLGALIPSAPTTGDEAAKRPERGGRPVDVFFAGDAPRASVAVLDRPTRAGQPAPTGDTQPTSPSSETSTATATTQPTAPQDGRPDQQSATPQDAQPRTATAEAQGAASDGDLVGVPGATFAELPIDDIRPNARQPRQVFDEEDLNELIASIREVGVLQPIVVRRVDHGYELVMGERRWRACRAAGLTVVPAIIRETADTAMLRDALLENLHRSELNPLEEAAAYDQLLKDFDCSHEELASRLGRSRPQISNTLRLLNLPSIVQRRVAAGVLTAGHARALLGLADPARMERLAQRIVAEGLSVRATEEIVALGGDEDEPTVRRTIRAAEPNERLDSMAARLGDRLDTRVKIAMGARRGRMTVEFADLDDLERIIGVLDPQQG